MEEFSHMSERNGDKARFYKSRKKRLLRRKLLLSSASSQKAGSLSGDSHEKKEPVPGQNAIPVQG